MVQMVRDVFFIRRNPYAIHEEHDTFRSRQEALKRFRIFAWPEVMTLTFVIFSASSVSLVARISTSLSFSFMLVTVLTLNFCSSAGDTPTSIRAVLAHKTINSSCSFFHPTLCFFDPTPFKSPAAIKCARTSENRTKKSSRRRMRASETSRRRKMRSL